MKFTQTFCAECDERFGPGDHGYARCVEHEMAPHDVTAKIKAAFSAHGVDDLELQITIAVLCFRYAKQERRRVRQIAMGAAA